MKRLNTVKLTTDPVEAYTCWAGANPPEDLEIINAAYWESAHWTKEYILYLKFKPTDTWWNGFIEQNQLTKDSEQWVMPADSPAWFKIPDGVTLYKRENDVFDSRYFRDEKAGECYVYEIQL